MALLSAEHLAGPGYIILNVLRGLNIIALASVVASNVTMIVKTFVISKFFFFDASSHLITGVIALCLIVSECSLFRGYFARNWPVLSPSHGFVFLGAAMMVLGMNQLGNMNKQATSQESLGMPFWRLLVASGCLAIVIGFFNIVASYIFCDKSRHITARRVRSHGAISLTESQPDLEAAHDPKLKAFTLTSQYTGSSTRTASPPLRVGTPPVDMGSPQQPQHATSPQKNTFAGFDFNPMHALRTARNSVLPSYHSNSASPRGLFANKRTSSIYSRSTSGQTKRSFWLKHRTSEVPHVPEISGPMNVNPQFAHLVKPNLAHHPSQKRGEGEEFNKI